MPQFLPCYCREPQHTPTVNKDCNQWPFQLKITEQGHKAFVLDFSHCCISGCLLIQDSVGYLPAGFIAEWGKCFKSLFWIRVLNSFSLLANANTLRTDSSREVGQACPCAINTVTVIAHGSTVLCWWSRGLFQQSKGVETESTLAVLAFPNWETFTEFKGICELFCQKTVKRVSFYF